MRRFLQVALALFAASTVLFALTRSQDAEASVAYVSPYTYQQTFGTALRLLRVDMGYQVTETEKDLGYVLFDYESPEGGDRVTKGSVELVPNEEGILVTFRLPAMPSYHERMLSTALTKKLEDEHGAPPRRKKTKPKPDDDDESDDDKSDDDRDAGKKKREFDDDSKRKKK